MRFIILFIIFLTAGSIACQKFIVQTQDFTNDDPQLKDEKQQTPEPDFILDKNKQISIAESFVNKDSISLNGFEIKKINVIKNHSEAPEPAEIIDAFLTKNGKRIYTFEGVFYPLGNQIDFGLFSFSNDSNEQLIIVDSSNRYQRDWIIDLSKGFKILFDSGNFEIYRSGLARIDFNDDGIYEITATKSDNTFNFAQAYIPRHRIIFQFDKNKQKFLPASNKFPEFTLDGIEEKIKEYNESNHKQFYEVLEITLTYIYAGKEDKAWKFFDENFIPEVWTFGKVEDKKKTKDKIIKSLNKNPIYLYIKNK